ncbi:MAG: prepilin peptidase [Candidatus Diapherotrites archaeon]|uniref:Prepilin peptidase n=1 Tax=Candidatus Iainarchaeum sp. TaxID=3101447 RepID=A0A8T4C7I4_9ARCH|nr:prepilin peptidase [Candidatus Diapherotrites archaeon]
MVVEQIQFAANMIAGAAAAYTDWKTGYIYDYITYPLIGLGIILSLMTGQWLGLVLGAGIYGIGLFAYKTGKIGGGDIKLLAGLALIQPTFNGMIFPFAVLLVGTLLACLGLSIYYTGMFVLSRKKIHWKNNRKKSAALMGAAVAGVMYYVFTQGLWSSETIVVLSIAMLAGIIFYALEEEIKEHSFLKRITLNELEDDEVLAIEHLSPEEKEKWGKNIPNLIGTSDKIRLQHMNFHTIPVYRNLPKFAPFLFAGIIIVYMYPEWITPLIPGVL